jgi:hypothetical protein
MGILFCVALSPASNRFINRLKEAERYFYLTSFMYSYCFMVKYKPILLSKETNRNEKALKPAHQIIDRGIKISSSLQTIRNEMQRFIENSQTEKVVPVPESWTNVESLNF